MKKILFYDCFAGISGDMNLGALVDLGVDAAHLEKELEKLNIEGFRLEVKSDMRKGISGTKVTVVVDHPENEKHRHLRHIEDLINNSTLSDRIKEKSLAIFNLVAEAEAKVHNISKEQLGRWIPLPILLVLLFARSTWKWMKFIPPLFSWVEVW